MTWNAFVTTIANALSALEVHIPKEPGGSVASAFALWHDLTVKTRDNNGTIYLAGNGASASMASHFAADLAKNGGMRTRIFTDGAELTAIGNDVGFDQVFALPLERDARKGDMLVAISSSGSSPNILNAAYAAHRKQATVITLTGFKHDNPLSRLGDINFHVCADTYGLVESSHATILHFWMDHLVEMPQPRVK